MADDSSVPADARAAIRNYVRDAEMLEDLLDERQDKLRRVAQAIIDAQPGFFVKGFSALRPLTMRTVADKVGVHDTTVSRTVRDKYMTTPFGTVELRRFFTSGIATEGGGQVSNTAVQSRLKALVEAEDREHPLSDDRLAAMLQAEGVKIARRTVAKYRKELKIPGATERRNMV